MTKFNLSNGKVSFQLDSPVKLEIFEKDLSYIPTDFPYDNHAIDELYKILGRDRG